MELYNIHKNTDVNGEYNILLKQTSTNDGTILAG